MASSYCIMGIMLGSYHYIRMLIISLLAGLTLVIWFPVVDIAGSDSDYLTVRFLDVGQGDAVHLVTPDGYEFLIDGGPSSMVLRELAEDRSFFDRSIDMVLATHPDSDHIAGLIDVLERYTVDWILETGVQNNTSVSKAYDVAVSNEEANVLSLEAGQIINLGKYTQVRILSPLGNTENWNSNSASVIVQIVYGDVEFMLTGDAPSEIEKYLVRKYEESLESEVLKLGHHGSKTSSDDTFLDIVNPEFAVVSAGKDNRYGHPHTNVVDKVLDRGIELVSTIEQGTIVFKSDGTSVWLEK